MARYTGPKHKLARREGVNVIEKTSASLQRRLNIIPGVHGKKGRRRLSEYGQQLREKQKLKATYGLLEKQLSRLVALAEKQKGETGELLVGLLESRLDNVVYRLGFAKSRFGSRQLVSHGHILVNGRKVTIPSYHVSQDDVVTLSSKMLKNPNIAPLLEEVGEIVPFLERKGTSGKLIRTPHRDDVKTMFNTQLIVEYYSR